MDTSQKRDFLSFALAIPCHNEERRLDGAALLALTAEPGVSLVFVNDGSTDGTEARLRALAAERRDRCSVLSLPENRGKGEAVRQALLHALAEGADVVGYFDADLATPVPEILRLMDQMRGRSDLTVLMAARVGLLGRRIERNPVRHYLGRFFATAASMVLDFSVYDTQCGTKFFRSTPALRAALSVPFVSRWVFDVELLGRLVIGAPGVAGVPLESIHEEPLNRWRDVPQSKLRAGEMLGAARDLVAVRGSLRARSRASSLFRRT